MTNKALEELREIVIKTRYPKTKDLMLFLLNGDKTLEIDLAMIFVALDKASIDYDFAQGEFTIYKFDEICAVDIQHIQWNPVKHSGSQTPETYNQLLALLKQQGE